MLCKPSDKWRFIIEAYDADASAAKLTVGDEVLVRLSYNCWQVPAHGELVISPASSLKDEHVLLLGKSNPFLIFRMSGRRGFAVSQVGRGEFAVVVPKSWQRDRDVAGAAAVSPEPFDDPAYQVHFFSIQDGAAIGFLCDDTSRLTLSSPRGRFHLTGNQVLPPDGSLGPLFGGGPPQLVIGDSPGAPSVRRIVIVEEGVQAGERRERWSTATNGSPTFDLDAAFKDVTGGWYSVRLYDNDAIKLASLPFRFVRTLTGVRVSLQPWPAETGHRDALVMIEHAPGSHPRPITSDRFEVERVAEGEIHYSIPARTLRATFRLSGSSTDIPIQLDRVWWMYGREGETLPPLPWTDQPIDLTIGHWRADSDAIVYICVPAAWVQSDFFISSEGSTLRRYRAVRCHELQGRGLVTIPLRDHAEAVRYRRGFELSVWSPPESLSRSIPLARVVRPLGDPAPPPSVQPITERIVLTAPKPMEPAAIEEFRRREERFLREIASGRQNFIGIIGDVLLRVTLIGTRTLSFTCPVCKYENIKRVGLPQLTCQTAGDKLAITGTLRCSDNRCTWSVQSNP